MKTLGAPAGEYHQHWCSMWADRDTELFEMAMKLSLKPYWSYELHGLLRFDLVPTKRTQAIQRGAIVTGLAAWYQYRVEGTLNNGAREG